MSWRETMISATKLDTIGSIQLHRKDGKKGHK